MSCCNGRPEMKDLNHVRILAQAYGKIECIDKLVIYETNLPPVGKAYDFEPAAYGRTNIVETVQVRDNSGGTILSDNGGRKRNGARKPITEASKETIEPGGNIAEVS